MRVDRGRHAFAQCVQASRLDEMLNRVAALLQHVHVQDWALEPKLEKLPSARRSAGFTKDLKHVFCELIFAELFRNEHANRA